MGTLFLWKKNTTLALVGLFVCVLFFSAGEVRASYQQYLPNSTFVIGEFIYNDDYTPTTDNCYLTVFDPTGATSTDTQLMTADPTGWHHYSVTVSSMEGTWPAYIRCGSTGTGDLIKEDKTFIITSNIVSSSSVATLVNTHTDTALLTASTSLASNINNNTNTATAGVTSGVNAHTDIASSSIGSSLTSIAASIVNIPANVWSYSGRTLTSFGTLAADIWSYSTRELTDAVLGGGGNIAVQSDITTASSSLAAVINGHTDTALLAASTSLASNINTNTNAQTSAVTSAVNTHTDTASSSLASVINSNTNTQTSNVTSNVDNHTDAALLAASTSIAAVVNGNTNTIVTAASSSLGASLSSIASAIVNIPSNVWSYSGRTLTSFGTLAADIWSYSTRTLTSAVLGGGGNIAVQSDVTTASSSLAAVINGNTNSATSGITSDVNSHTDTALLAASTSLASNINTNTNSIVLLASTSIGALITGSGGGSLTAAQVWSYGTRTLTAAGLTSGSLALQSDVTTASSSLAAVINTNTNTQTSGITSSVNANTNSIVTAASSSLGATLSTIVSSISSIPANVWASGTRTLTSGVAIASDIWGAATRTLTGAGLSSGSLAQQSDVTTASSSLAAVINANTTSVVTAASSSLGAAIQNLTVSSGGWNAQMSDFASALAGGTYRTQVTIYNQNTLADPQSVPTVTIYDPSRNMVVTGVPMTKVSTGVYEYNYSISSSAAAGAWETVASITASGSNTLQTNDYWDVVTTPAQVLIQSMGTTETPSISANIRITNEGAVDNEYPYEWCVVADQNNACGGGNDTYYASAAKLIHPGQNFDTTLTATVPLAGTYYFKVVAYFGTQSSGASRQFTATAPSNSSNNGGGGSGGGGGGGGALPAAQPTVGAGGPGDINGDGKVNGIDFSILLAYWKTKPPFKNPAVDLNHDGKVDGIDFSILLYRWGK